MTVETLAALRSIAHSAPALTPTSASRLRALLPTPTASEVALAA
ncbi:hypothetical protein [Curtobacterium sp. MCPF17_051]|nr:hypothetical protein [Curtobacterium sp. MCPF17_051]